MNLSKKTRKRIYRTVLANCHMKNGMVIPFESSMLSTIWKFFAISDKRYSGRLYGVFLDDRAWKDESIHLVEQDILSPEQLFNPHCPIEIGKQIVERWVERGYSWKEFVL